VLEHGFALAASRQTASYNEFRLAPIVVRDKAEVLSKKLPLSLADEIVRTSSKFRCALQAAVAPSFGWS
jgi:hypothetical protein